MRVAVSIRRCLFCSPRLREPDISPTPRSSLFPGDDTPFGVTAEMILGPSQLKQNLPHAPGSHAGSRIPQFKKNMMLNH